MYITYYFTPFHSYDSLHQAVTYATCSVNLLFTITFKCNGYSTLEAITFTFPRIKCNHYIVQFLKGYVYIILLLYK